LDQADISKLHGTETILIAEDDEPLRVLISSILSEFGYKVLIAADGDEAVEIFRANKDSIDIAVLDMIMPGKNGREVFELITSMKPDIRCILASGYTPDMCLDTGSTEERIVHIMKPFPPLELIKEIRHLLTR